MMSLGKKDCFPTGPSPRFTRLGRMASQSSTVLIPASQTVPQTPQVVQLYVSSVKTFISSSVRGLGPKILARRLWLLDLQLSPPGVLIHGSNAGPIRSHREGRAPLHTLLTSVAAVYFHELGGHHIARHQGLGAFLISHFYSPPLLARRVMGVAMTWMYLLHGKIRANRPIARTV